MHVIVKASSLTNQIISLAFRDWAFLKAWTPELLGRLRVPAVRLSRVPIYISLSHSHSGRWQFHASSVVAFAPFILVF